jgi:hypothetical protein
VSEEAYGIAGLCLMLLAGHVKRHGSSAAAVLLPVAGALLSFCDGFLAICWDRACLWEAVVE